MNAFTRHAAGRQATGHGLGACPKSLRGGHASGLGRSAARQNVPMARAIGRALRLASPPEPLLAHLRRGLEQVPRIFSAFGHACIALIALLFIATASAQNAAPPAAGAPDPLADRMHRLTQDLRCLVCQNESLADSHAPLAMDLKREIRALMAQGQSDAQIRDFLTQRYGDFVNYQPPLRAGTLLLWAGPLLMLAAGGWLVWRSVRASQRHRLADGGDGGDGRDGGRTGDEA